MNARLERMEALEREALHLALEELEQGTAASGASDVCELLTRVASGGTLAFALQRALTDIGRRTILAATAEGVPEATLHAALDAGRRSVRCPCARCVAEKAQAAS